MGLPDVLSAVSKAGSRHGDPPSSTAEIRSLLALCWRRHHALTLSQSGNRQPDHIGPVEPCLCAQFIEQLQGSRTEPDCRLTKWGHSAIVLHTLYTQELYSV